MDRVIAAGMVLIELGTQFLSLQSDSLDTTVLGVGAAGLLGLFRVVDRRIARIFEA